MKSNQGLSNTRGWSQKKADFAVALISLSWGSSYLMSKIGLDGISPYCLIALRFGIAFIVVGLIFFRKMLKTTKRCLGYGVVLGFLLFAVFAFLLHGLQTTTASNGGFLTSTTVVIVPILQTIVYRKLPSARNVIGTLLTIAGIAMLTLSQSLTTHIGDLLCLVGAIIYAVHILVTDKLTHKEDGLIFGIWQLGFAAFFGMIFSMLFEQTAFPQNSTEWGAVLGLAIVCSAFGFVMQPVAQRYTTPDHTALLFALEPIFSAILAFIFLHERFTALNYFGAVLVLAGVAAASITPKARQSH